MADYLKLFHNESEYIQWQNSESYLTPNVCKIIKNNSIMYNPVPEVVYDPYNGHEYVDLGLPSGLKWAKYNVGATNEAEAGLYFSWGDIQGYTEEQITSGMHSFSYENYLYATNDIDVFTKYNSEDGLTELLPEDDAAHINMGGDWRMPTKEDFKELSAHTTSAVIVVNGVSFRRFISTINGNKLFVFSDGVWSSSLDRDNFSRAWCMDARSSNAYMPVHNYARYFGERVRGVVG